MHHEYAAERRTVLPQVLGLDILVEHRDAAGRQGLSFLWRNRLLRALALMVGLFNTATSATSAILILFAVGPRSAMGLSAQLFGVLLAGTAAGSVLGSLGAELVIRLIGRACALLVSLLGGGLFVGIPALTANPVVVGVAFFVGGVGIVCWNVVTVSFRQRITPDRLLGRVNNCYRLVAWVTMPLGAAADGLLAKALGLRAVFALMAALTLALCFGLLFVTDRRMEAAERQADLGEAQATGPLLVP